LRWNGAVVHDVSQPQNELDVLVLHVVGNPLRLRLKNLRKIPGVVLRIRQRDDRELVAAYRLALA